MNKSIIIGNGEIGKALRHALETHDYDDNIMFVDIDGEIKCTLCADGIPWEEDHKHDLSDIFIMHVCFPYSDTFIDSVKKYQERFSPKFTIIHSTVPVGTSRKCGALHSPVSGEHPFLTESILKFVKFIGGEGASEVADYFRKKGIRVFITDKQESTELAKLACTTTFGIEVEMTKEVKRICDKYNVPFELYVEWTREHNNGVTAMGKQEHCRPILIPLQKPQGGHCTRNNAKLYSDSVFADLLLRLNGDKDG